MGYSNALFSALSFIGFVLTLIPLYWHLEAWNVGTILFMVWAGLGCLNGFINSVIWNHSIANVAPVWCDISTRFAIGLDVALPAAMLVIQRRLYHIASRTQVITTKAERLRAVYVDLAIGLSIPILQMILQIIVEAHRFDIYQEIGCVPVFYNVALAFPISYIWGPILLTITLVYSLLNIRIFWKSSRMLNGMPGSNNNPNQSRYIRLIMLSVIQVLSSLPISLFNLYASAYYIPVLPWISWDVARSNYSEVNQFSSIMWRAGPTNGVLLELGRWMIVVAALLFFAFFGFAEEARKHYRKAYSFASSTLRLPDMRNSRASSSLPSTPSSSFGHGFMKGIATFSSFRSGFSAFGSRSTKSETTMERKDSFWLSENRLTSSSSIFDGVDHSSKALEISPGDDDSQLASAPAPASRSAIEASAAASNRPVPPPSMARVSVLSHPPGLYPAFPHSPTSSDLYLDPSEAV